MHFVELENTWAGVELAQMEPLTLLFVATWHSVYRIVVVGGIEVLVQGGRFFPDLTPADLHGRSAGGHALKPGWIGVGHRMAFRTTGHVIVTSPVVAITAERGSVSMVQ